MASAPRLDPSQAARQLRLNPRHRTLCVEALKHHIDLKLARSGAGVLMVRLKQLSTGSRYRLYLSPTEWEILSRALRVGAPQPPPGSCEIKWWALYKQLIPQMRGFRTLASMKRVP